MHDKPDTVRQTLPPIEEDRYDPFGHGLDPEDIDMIRQRQALENLGRPRSLLRNNDDED